MSNNHLIKAYSLSLGNHRGNSRVWLESQKIYETSLANNMTYSPRYDLENKRIILEEGNLRTISERKKENRAVIDINNSTVTEIFKGYSQITIRLYEEQIVIEPLREEIEQKRAKDRVFSKPKSPTILDIFSGGGTLIRAARDSGMTVVAAIELEDKYLENTEANNPGIFTYCGDLVKLDVNNLPKDVDIISCGIPCTPFSVSQLKSKGLDHPEGSLGFYVLKIVEAIRPSIVWIEEVSGFSTSPIAQLTRYVLSAMGYTISEKMLIGSEYGSLTKRKRFCMVASIKGKFEFEDKNITTNKTVKDILEIPFEDREWLTRENSRTIAYSLSKEKEHIAKGNGFRIARTTPNDSVVATITKGYYKNRLTDPVLFKERDGVEYFSWFTPRELARVNGLPDDFILPDVRNTSGEIIGQGICYEVFKSVGEQIIEHLNSDIIEEDVYDTVSEESLFSVFANNKSYSNSQLEVFASGSLF